jgi:hypothetical protein
MAGSTRCWRTAPSGGREEVGFQRQEQDEENAQEEGGGGLADEGEPHGHMVEDRVALHGRQEPDGHGHDGREEESGQPQLEGGPEIAAHHREGGLSEVERPAEVEPEGIAEENRVLDGNRTIEAELTAHPVHLADGRVGGQEEGHGIAGEPHHDEDHGGNEPESDQGAEEPLDDERENSAHGESPFTPARSPRGERAGTGTALRPAKLEVEPADLELLVRVRRELHVFCSP